MRHSFSLVCIAIVCAFCALLAGAVRHPANAQQSTELVSGALTTGLGHVDVTGQQFRAAADYFEYIHAHMKTQNGVTVDCDDLKANIKPGAGSNGIVNIIASGNVKAHAVDAGKKSGQGDVVLNDYTILADKAVYDPNTNQIDLTGHIRTEIRTGMTDGPVVQTGDTATLQLNKGGQWNLTMSNVHATFTPKTNTGSGAG